jgi:hypothetical protein
VFAEEMAMLPHVWTKAGWAPIQRHLTKQAASHQHAETIVDRREGDLRHAPLHAIKDLVGCRMVVAIGHDLEDLAALPRKTKTRRLERVLQPFAKRGMFESGDSARTIPSQTARVNQSLNEVSSPHFASERGL